MELTLLKGDGDVLCARCRLADTPITRFKGLLGRRELGADEGMLLATGAIHTSFMRFAIDVAFLDRNFVVLRTIDTMKPWRVAWQRRAHAVVELPPGALERAGVQAGERMSLVRHAPPVDSDVPERRTDGDAALRVAVASPDSRFLRVAQFLLSRQPFDVETFRDTRSLMKSRTPSDVVVLDSSTSLATTARVMRELTVVNPATRFVVVGEAPPNGNGDTATHALRVLPKWDSFDRIVEEILSASQSQRDGKVA
jgi:uncharacterized membrane protein (UPF0127 family)